MRQKDAFQLDGNNRAGPGFMHWHEGYSYDYFKMLTAEKMDTSTSAAAFLQ